MSSAAWVDRGFAGFAQRNKTFFHAEQDATGSRSRGGTLLVEIRLARLTHRGGLRQRRPALLMEILEVRFDAFGKRVSLQFGDVTELGHVSRAGLNDGDVLPESRLPERA